MWFKRPEKSEWMHLEWDHNQNIIRFLPLITISINNTNTYFWLGSLQIGFWMNCCQEFNICTQILFLIIATFKRWYSYISSGHLTFYSLINYHMLLFSYHAGASVRFSATNTSCFSFLFSSVLIFNLLSLLLLRLCSFFFVSPSEREAIWTWKYFFGISFSVTWRCTWLLGRFECVAVGDTPVPWILSGFLIFNF